MLLDDYQKAIEDLLHTARDSQRENVIKAGQLIADSIDHGGNIYLSGICHSIEMDLVNRGGGPLFYQKFAYKLDITEQKGPRKRNRSDIDTNMEGLAAYAIKASSMRPGDVLFVGSVSGRTLSVVDLAVEAKKFGIKVIAFTSLTYAKAVEPVHSSGKKLHEIVDVVIDNCAPAAEGMMQVDGIEAPFAAASGISSDFLLWSITSVAVEELMKRGKTPGILKSYNFPGGREYDDEILEPQYAKLGY